MEALKKATGYTYWVRQDTQQAAPAPVHRRLSATDIAEQNTAQAPPLGSVWNQMSGSMLQHAAFKASISSEVASGLLGGVATEMSGNMLYARSLQGIDIVAGTWEEKSLNSWALARVKELLLSADTVSFPQGTARVIEVSSCTGDATLVTVRKKKRVGYSFEITIKFNGEITSSGEPKNLEGSVKLLEAAYGELDDLQVEVTLKDRTVPANEKSRVSDAIGKSFLPVLRQQLALFEAELEER